MFFVLWPRLRRGRQQKFPSSMRWACLASSAAAKISTETIGKELKETIITLSNQIKFQWFWCLSTQLDELFRMSYNLHIRIFHPKLSLLPPMVFRFSGTYISAQRWVPKLILVSFGSGWYDGILPQKYLCREKKLVIVADPIINLYYSDCNKEVRSRGIKRKSKNDVIYVIRIGLRIKAHLSIYPQTAKN